MSHPRPAALPPPTQGYGAVTRSLHWVAALVAIGAWTLGISMDEFPRGAARSSALGVHSLLGVTVLTLTVLRILWRGATTTPPPDGPAWMVMLAKLGHAGLYALTVALPVTGLLSRWTRSGTVTLIGGWSLPAPFPLPATRIWGHLHGPLAYALAALVAAHVAAALFHHLVLRDGTMRRMVPALSR